MSQEIILTCMLPPVTVASEYMWRVKKMPTGTHARMRLSVSRHKHRKARTSNELTKPLFQPDDQRPDPPSTPSLGSLDRHRVDVCDVCIVCKRCEALTRSSGGVLRKHGIAKISLGSCERSKHLRFISTIEASIMANISPPTLLATFQTSHASSSKNRHVSLSPVLGSEGELAVLAVHGDGVWTYDVSCAL